MLKLVLYPLLLSVFLSFSGSEGKAETVDLSKAETAYQAGDYAGASALYLKAVEADEPKANASVFHNLGLALDRQKELGVAVAAYLRALQLDPRQGDFEYNLNFLLAQTADKLDNKFETSPFRKALLGEYISEREIFYLGLLTLVLTALALSYGILRTRFKKSAFAFASVFGIFTIFASVSFVLETSASYDTGAVTLPKVEAYAGPTQSVVIFELHQGAPFQILEKSGDWVKIRLSDQKRGWVRVEGIASFGRKEILLPAHVSSKS